MEVRVEPVRSAKEKSSFINFEWEANRETPNWVSPLKLARKDLLNPKKNPFFLHSEIEMFLAHKNGKIVGRIAAITNQNYNDFHNDKTGFWGFFDCINDQDTANALFRAAAEWLKGKKRDVMIGPMNPSTNDEAGLLIEGFDTPPYLMMTHNPDYYPGIVEGFGNVKAKDLYAWIITTEEAEKNITEKMVRVSDKIIKKYDLKIRNLKVKDLKNEIKLVKEIYNNAWSENWGFVPFTDEEINHVAADLKDIADENLLLLAEKNGEPIGFSVTLPNINEILARIPNGRLLPTGIFKLLAGLKKIKTVRVVILGVKKEYQFIGLGSIFYIESIRRARKLGYQAGEMSWILEDNNAMNRAIEAVGSKIYKKYRIYSFPL
ncbi:MAG: N-acetyltransferase [Calditrichaceae bacterium]